MDPKGQKPGGRGGLFGRFPGPGAEVSAWLCLLAGLFFPGIQASIRAQVTSPETRFVWLRADDGLPSSRVNCLLQDPRGFLWLGTDAGLSRYDGRHVQSYGLRDGLPHIQIDQLSSDGQGTLWALGGGQLAGFSDAHFALAPEPEEGLEEPYLHVGTDSEGQLLAATAKQLFRLSDGQMRPVMPPAGGAWDHPQPLGSGSEETWLFDRQGGGHALVRLRGKQSQTFPLPWPAETNRRFLAVQDSRGRWIYAARQGLVLFDPGSGQGQVLYLPEPPSDPSAWRALLLDKNQRLWLAAGGEMVRCWHWPSSNSRDSLRLYPLRSAAPPREIRDLLQDREGNIWFGTGEDGAAFLPGNASFVRNLTAHSGLADHVVLSIAGEGNQNIWFGMRSGQVHALNFAGIGGVGSPVLGRAGNSPVRCLAEAADGSMFAGSEDGLFRSRYRLLERHGPLRGVRDLAQGWDSFFYVGTASALYRFSPSELDALALAEQQEELKAPLRIASRPALLLAAHPEGGCWYANEEGLFRFDGVETRRIPLPPGVPAATLSDMDVVGACLALATRGEGLLIFCGDTLSWQLDALNGLPSNLCNSLYAAPLPPDSDSGSTLWVATNRGIARLQLDDIPGRLLRYETYDTRDGLLSNEVNALIALRGSLYLGSNAGISIFNESDFRVQSAAPGIYLMGVAVADRDTSVLASYELPYSQNRVSIRFSGIAFGSSNLIQYRYRLEGLDEDWISSANAEVRYASLSPGQYRFEVQAVGKDGLLSEDVAAFDLRIRHPWYQSGWFLFVAGLVLAGLTFGLYSLLLGRLERHRLQRAVSAKTAELDHKIRELRRSNDELQQFAYIASHDLKEPLRNIANYVQLLERRLNGQLDAEAHQYMHFAVNGVNRMYDMIAGLLRYSGLTRPDPSVEPLQLDEVLQSALDRVTQRHPERRIALTAEPLPALMANSLQLGELMEQLLDNAVKFNRSAVVQLRIRASEDEDEVRISVQDNGMGLNESFQQKVFQIFERLEPNGDYPGSGMGLALCKKIVERHGGRIWYESEEGKGATFHFTLRKNLRNQTR
jgi:signal transduction histidine kinase